MFTLIYLMLGLAVLAVELYGVWHSGRMDTISEHYWWVQRRSPMVRIVFVVLWIWLFVHFMWGDRTPGLPPPEPPESSVMEKGGE